MISGLFVIIIPLALLVFWAWMFWEMLNNTALPPSFFSFTKGLDVRTDWIVWFIILSLITAGYYYLTVYSKKTY